MANFRFGSHWIGLRYSGALPAATLAVVLMIVAAALSWRFDAWKLLVVGGGGTSLIGTIIGAQRLLRVGPAGLDDPLPPATIRERPTDRGVRFNWPHVEERSRRAADAYAALVGLLLAVAGAWAGIIGTLLAG